MRSTSSRKGQTSITHLMSFALPPRPENHLSSYPRGRRSANWGARSYHAVDKSRCVMPRCISLRLTLLDTLMRTTALLSTLRKVIPLKQPMQMLIWIGTPCFKSWRGLISNRTTVRSVCQYQLLLESQNADICFAFPV